MGSQWLDPAGRGLKPALKTTTNIFYNKYYNNYNYNTNKHIGWLFVCYLENGSQLD